MNSITILLIGTVAGFVLGVSAAVLVYLRAQHDQRGDAELLDALQENGWHLGYMNGNFAVLGGTPQRVIGEPGDDVREVLHRALELLEVGAAPITAKEPKNG